MVSEITSLSTIHQTRDNDYQSVEKIMHAFSNALSDPKKPKREILDDATEVGRNRALANHLFESDIVLTVPQMKGIVMAEKEQIEAVYRGRVKRKVITGLVYRWPKGKPIPYRFKEQDASWRKQIREAIGMWEKETCVRFQENYGAFDHVIFYKGSGCFSGIGKTGGSQMISIGYGCDNVGIIAHEIGHTLGFWHEQSRPDRDYYINIRREYIAAGAEANFLRQTLLETDNMGLPYDMGSVMHYGPEAFSTRAGQITIATNDPRFENTIGQRNSPSFIDIKQINRLYCNDACVGMQLACRHGGYPDPNNCQLCKCPPGLTGSICNDVEAGSCGGSDLTAATGWQEINHTGKGDCAWRIKTKNGKIRMRLSGSKYSCESTCNAYVEIKAGSDFQQTGFRVCCEDKIVEVVSESEEVLIISHGAGLRRESGFRLQYIKANAHSEVVPGSEVKPQPAPSIKWTPGQENRHFRGVENVPIEQFILNAIPHIRDPAHPEASIASMVADYALSGIFSIGKK